MFTSKYVQTKHDEGLPPIHFLGQLLICSTQHKTQLTHSPPAVLWTNKPFFRRKIIMPVARGNRRRRRTTPPEELEEEEDDDAFSFGGDDGGTSPCRRTSPRRARGRGGGGRGRGRTQDTDVAVADDDDDADHDMMNSQMTENKNSNDKEGENDNGDGDDHNYDEDVASAAGRYGRSQQSVTAGTVMTSATQIDDQVDGDTLRIMLSTDNHLGYQETNTIRGNDSFAALEEVLYLARRYKCDMVLLAGDLFHDNRPSRRTLFKTSKSSLIFDPWKGDIGSITPLCVVFVF